MKKREGMEQRRIRKGEKGERKRADEREKEKQEGGRHFS